MQLTQPFSASTAPVTDRRGRPCRGRGARCSPYSGSGPGIRPGWRFDELTRTIDTHEPTAQRAPTARAGPVMTPAATGCSATSCAGDFARRGSRPGRLRVRPLWETLVGSFGETTFRARLTLGFPGRTCSLDGRPRGAVRVGARPSGYASSSREMGRLSPGIGGGRVKRGPPSTGTPRGRPAATRNCPGSAGTGSSRSSLGQRHGDGPTTPPWIARSSSAARLAPTVRGRRRLPPRRPPSHWTRSAPCSRTNAHPVPRPTRRSTSIPAWSETVPAADALTNGG